MRQEHPSVPIRRHWPPRHVGPLALTASVILHLLALLFAGRVTRPAGAPAPEPRDRIGTMTIVTLPPPITPVILPPPVIRSDAPRATPPPAAADTASAPASAPASPGISAPPATGPADTRRTAVGSGRGFGAILSDPRLHTDATSRRVHLQSERSSETSLRGRFEGARAASDSAISKAEGAASAARQVSVFGRRFTIFGDSAAATMRNLSAVAAGERMVLPTDGREWEENEMRRQSREFVRDSIRKARIRATRERIDAERAREARSAD